jgi:putative flippase GtrA
MDKKMQALDSWILTIEHFFIKLFRLNKFEEKILKILNPETIIYLFVGVMTTIINLAVYYIFLFLFNDKVKIWLFDSTQIANAIAWVVAMAGTFFPNKLWVFRQEHKNWNQTGKEFVSFAGSRVVTLAIEWIGLAVFCTWLGFSPKILKLFIAVIVVILNYVFSKLFTFSKKKS